jgi:hypothetical protein
MKNVNCPAVDRAIIHAHLAMVARGIESPGWEIWAFNWVTGIDRSNLDPDDAPEITGCRNDNLDVWYAARDATGAAKMLLDDKPWNSRLLAASSIGSSAASMINAPESYIDRNRAYTAARVEEFLRQAGEVPDGQ